MASNTVILITGANTGLGLQTAQALLRSSSAYTVLIGSRSLEKANTAIQSMQTEFPNTKSMLKAIQIDIEDDDSINQAFDHISQTEGRLDVLINNAGAQFDQQARLGSMTLREAWNKSWNVNTTSTYMLTDKLIPLLLKSSDPRILFITSGTSTLAETDNLALKINQPPAKGWPKQDHGVAAYRSAKTGMNMMMREWVRMLSEDGFKIWCISPGFLATGLGGDQAKNKQMGAQDPVIGAEFIRSVVEGARDQDVGKVIRRDDVQPW